MHLPATTCTLLAALCAISCKGKQDDKPLSVPPPIGAANEDELTTPLGRARGLESSLVASSAVFERATVTGPSSAALFGATETEYVALVTDDGAKSFRALRGPKKDWASFAAGPDRSIALAHASRAEPPKAKSLQLFTAGSVQFSDETFTSFEAPIGWSDAEVVATGGKPAAPTLFIRGAFANFGGKKGALVYEDEKRRGALRFVGPGGQTGPTLGIPAGERIVSMPYGSPPALLTVRGAALLHRPMPARDEPLANPQQVAGLSVSAAAEVELAKPPCEAGGMGMRVVPQPGGKATAFLASSAKVSSIVLPPRQRYAPDIGCGERAFVVHHVDGQGYFPTLCDWAGACKTSSTPAFRIWQVPHAMQLWSVPTSKGGAIAFSRSSAEKWEVAISISIDGFKTFDLPRVIGEGTIERGKVELGGLFSLAGERLVLLISADVTGTTRRGWYVIVSEDGGLTWSPP